MGSNPTPSACGRAAPGGAGLRTQGGACGRFASSAHLRPAGRGPRLRIPARAAEARSGSLPSLLSCHRLAGFLRRLCRATNVFGRVAEWLKAHDWKSCGLTPTWVRIPPRPLAAEPPPDGVGFEPRVEPAVLRILGSPSGGWRRPRLRIPPRPLTAEPPPYGAGFEPRVEPAALRVLGSPSGGWRRPRLRIPPRPQGGWLLSVGGRHPPFVFVPSESGIQLRGVAQSGRALRSGRRGPRFKSGRPD